MDEEISNQTADDATLKLEVKDLNRCGITHCQRTPLKESEHCIFHMSGTEKNERELWEKCSDQLMTELQNGEGDFRQSVLKDVSLAGEVLEQRVNLSGTTFLGRTDLSRAVFRDGADFRDSLFEGITDFQHAVFRTEADFSNSIFASDTLFRNSSFRGKTYFKRIRFQKVNFHNAIFREKCSFSPNRQDEEKGIPTFVSADFSGTHFENGGSFDYCSMGDGTFVDSSILNVSFRSVNLDHVKFAGALMESAYLSDSEWTVELGQSHYRSLMDWFTVHDPRLIIREEMEAREIPEENTQERLGAFKKAESTYRRIKHSLANEGDYEKAGEFYIHEMRMKKERYFHTPGISAKWDYFWNILYSWTCGYGERPKRVFLNAFIMITIFSLLYYAGAGIARGGDPDHDPSLRECVYFSVVTFTTLGYGDYAPKSNFQLIAVFEAFLGAFTIALFVLVFGRKVMR